MVGGEGVEAEGGVKSIDIANISKKRQPVELYETYVVYTIPVCQPRHRAELSCLFPNNHVPSLVASHRQTEDEWQAD
ncbi:hypothetical protein J6590_008335 [Homalodisca vitripennis]|nr:hypothetical protein J6590_008335 [Homalodisca vitripennis]